MVLNRKSALRPLLVPEADPERNVCGRVKRLADNPEVASILDMQRLNTILDSWPDSQPPDYSL
jgi:hypothetical protein